jgi:hypothetical protein
MSIGGGFQNDIKIYKDSEEVEQQVKLTIGTTEPADPKINDLWIDIS